MTHNDILMTALQFGREMHGGGEGGGAGKVAHTYTIAIFPTVRLHGM